MSEANLCLERGQQKQGVVAHRGAPLIDDHPGPVLGRDGLDLGGVVAPLVVGPMIDAGFYRLPFVFIAASLVITIVSALIGGPLALLVWFWLSGSQRTLYWQSNWIRAGIGIIIVLKQIPHALGRDLVAGSRVRAYTDAYRVVVRARSFAEYESYVVRLADRPVREVMTPRTEIVAIAEDAALGDITQVFAQSGYRFTSQSSEAARWPLSLRSISPASGRA